MGKHHRELSQIQEEHKVELNRMQKALDVVSVSINTSRHLQWAWKKTKQEGREGNARDLRKVSNKVFKGRRNFCLGVNHCDLGV